MKSTIDEFIKILKQKTPEEMNAVDMLTSIVPMSKEAAYRRLRGEIDFTVTEILKIAQKLNISLDNLIKPDKYWCYNVKTIPIKEESFMENYIDWAQNTLNSMRELRSRPEHYSISLNNNISLLYLFNYKMLSKLRLYKWMYQRNVHSKPPKISEFHIPPEIIAIEKMILKELHQTHISFIYAQEFIKSLTDDIDYFRHLDLISKEEVDQMKQESFSLLKDMENDAIQGKNQQMPCTIHVTNLKFDGDFVYWHNDVISKITFRLFGINHYSVDDAEAVNEMKNWINMLFKCSTLISFSGEKKRMEFFKCQRNILEQL